MAIAEYLGSLRDRGSLADDEPADQEPVSDAVPDPFESIASSFDEPIAPDPQPGRRKAKTSSAPGKVTAAQKRAVSDALEMMITLPAGMIAFKDPVCGGALVEHADNIVKKLTPIVCRNPLMVEWFTGTAGYLDWFGLATAIWPVVATVWSHHITKPQHEEGGVGYAHGGGEPDFSHYVAPSLG